MALLSDYAPLLAWAAAALVFYAGAFVANDRGWFRIDYRPMAALMLFAGVSTQRSSIYKHGQSRVPQAAVAEAAGGHAPTEESYAFLAFTAIYVLCLVIIAWVTVDALRMTKRMTPPPQQQQQSVPARRYADRRRA